MNVAGVGVTKLAVGVTEEDWDKVPDIDLKVVFFVSRKVAKLMIEQNRGGSIINVASFVVCVVFLRMAPYIAAKGGVLQMTCGLAYEWARFGIRVNCICPGYVHTGMAEGVFNDSQVLGKITASVPHPRKVADPIWFSKTSCATAPHPRKVADPLDIGAAALYLAADCPDFVTGSPIYVDGGRTYG